MADNIIVPLIAAVVGVVGGVMVALINKGELTAKSFGTGTLKVVGVIAAADFFYSVTHGEYEELWKPLIVFFIVVRWLTVLKRG